MYTLLYLGYNSLRPILRRANRCQIINISTLSSSNSLVYKILHVRVKNCLEVRTQYDAAIMLVFNFN